MKQTLLIIFLMTLPLSPQQANTPSAESIVQGVDNTLSPPVDFTMSVTVKDNETGKPERLTKFKMLAKGRHETLLMTLSPEASHGRNLLYNALDLWVFLPSVRKPFRISLQERLTGEAANADLARANYSRDYSPTLAAVETINGKPYYRLELTKKVDSAPYHRITMWAGVADFSPLKAEFYAVSGRLLKECLYERYVQFFEIKRPTRLVLKSAVDSGKSSTLEYSDWRQESLPEKFFDRSYIDKTKY
jgi:outer membrane lipoprotein-sorting protein